MDVDLRRQLGVRKSLQVLEELSTPKLKCASPMIRDAGTPSPFLNATANHSFYNEKDFSSEIQSPLHSEFGGTPNIKRYSSNNSFLQNSMLNASGLDKTVDVSSHAILLEKDPAMEGAGELFEEFMQLFCQHTHSSSVFSLVEEYELACRNKIKSLLEYVNKTDPSRRRMKNTVNLLNQLYRECYTWRLLASLFRDRIVSESTGSDADFAMAPPLDSSKSEQLIVDKLFEHESSTRQCQIIVDWLEKNMQDKLEDLLASEKLHFQSNSLYWEHTLHDLSQLRMQNKDPSISANLVTEIDPDAPIRQQRALSSLDQQDEEQLLVYMFRFIRAGKLEEAQKLCCDQGHFWRAATLDGWRLWHDPNYFNEQESNEILPAEGNPDRDLWKINCWSLSEDNGCSVYEKAIYASLSGHLKQLLPACNSWEDNLWAYFKTLVDVRVELEIRSQPRTKGDFLDLPEDYWKQESLNPADIIRSLENHSNMDIRRQGEDIYRSFQSKVILNQFDQLLLQMKKIIDSNKNDPHLYRCMAHFVLFLQSVGIQTEEVICIEVIHKYVQILIEKKQPKLVAIYTSRLPPQMQIDVYAQFLLGIENEGEREAYLKLGEQAGLDLREVTKKIVENICAKDYEKNDLDSSEFDDLKINAIKWLLFDDSQRAEAMKQANAICRVFLAAKNHSAAKAVFDILPADSVDVVYTQWRRRAGEKALPPVDDDAVREYFSIKAYMIAHDAFNVWFKHYHDQAPLEPKTPSGTTFKDQILYEESMKEYQDHFDRWQKTLEAHVKTTSNCIYNVFTFPSGWLVDKRDHKTELDEARQQQMSLLRHLCIPYLTFLLHNVLHSSKQYRAVLELAEVIQSKQYKLYEVFEKQELQKCLSLIRESCIALLDEGYDAFGYEKTAIGANHM